jgi:hypothetical protein
MQEGLEYLSRLLDKYDWFDEACIEGRRYIVYVFQMGSGIEENIPDQVTGYQVVVHFAAAKNIIADHYLHSCSKIGNLTLEDLAEELPSDLLIPDLSDLCKELDRLEKICGSNILQDIFYEIKDGKNAVTNLRAKFPDVHKAMIKLYDEYGFDPIYNEMDG